MKISNWQQDNYSIKTNAVRFFGKKIHFHSRLLKLKNWNKFHNWNIFTDLLREKIFYSKRVPTENQQEKKPLRITNLYHSHNTTINTSTIKKNFITKHNILWCHIISYFHMKMYVNAEILWHPFQLESFPFKKKKTDAHKQRQ